MRVIHMEYKAVLDKLENDKTTMHTYSGVYNAIANVAASTKDS